MKKLISLLYASTLLILPAFVACSPGCKSRELAPAGVYQGDKTLYNADKVISESYDVMTAFLRYEVQNREVLRSTPEVSKAADNIRDNAQRWTKSAVALRDAYASNPTSDNKNKLNQAIAILRQAVTEASGYLAKVK
jgi:hypothetical protein